MVDEPKLTTPDETQKARVFTIELLKFKIPPLILIEFAPAQLTCVANEYPPVLRVPLTTLMVTVVLEVAGYATYKAEPKVHTPPMPLKTTDPFSVVPLVVIVLPVVVALNVIAADPPFQTVPVLKDMLPLMVKDVPPENVTTPAETVISRQTKAPVHVTVYVPA